jgi:uncharacterized protein YkwD
LYPDQSVRGSEVSPLALDNKLQSLFDVDPTQYAHVANVDPPTITLFTTDQGQQKSQVLSADTQAVLVRGTVGSRDGEPLIRGDTYLAHPDDSVEQLSADVHGDEFSATFPITSGPGSYQIEIVDTTGSAVINAPLFVGVPYAPSPPVLSDPNLAPPDSEQQALDRLGSVRTNHGRKPLAIDPRLMEVAHDHLADMAANNSFFHCWTDGSSLLDHLTAIGIPVHWKPAPGQRGVSHAAFSEGIAFGGIGAGAIDELFSSPGHRFDLLGDYSHVGVAAGSEDAGPLLVIEYADES